MTEHPVFQKRLKRVEMLKHFDSHHHLVTTYAASGLRPVVLEVPVKANVGEDACRIDNEMLSVAAALVSDTVILIADMASMDGVETHDVNVIYLVFKSERNLDPMEHYAGPGKYKIYYHVQTIEEAFEHIKGKLHEVTEQANPKEPYELSDSLWSFMMSREIRIIGNFQHLACGLPHADVMQLSYPSTGAKEIFQTKSIGKRSFDKNNMVKVFQTYLDNPALVAGMDDRLSDPYFNLAHQNHHAEVRQGSLQVKLRRYSKNRMGRFSKDDVNDSFDSLVIISIDDYKSGAFENSLMILIDAGRPDCVGPLVDLTDSKSFINSFKTFSGAIRWVMDCVRPTIETRVGPAARLKYIKTIHVFTDVIDDAH